MKLCRTRSGRASPRRDPLVLEEVVVLAEALAVLKQFL